MRLALEPVEISTTSLGAYLSSSRASMSASGGTVRNPRSRAIPMLRTIERPTYADLAAVRAGGVIICWTRCTCRGKARHDDPRSLRAKTRSSTGPMSRSEVTKPGTSALVESTRKQVDALLAQPGEGAQVGEPAVERQLVHLEVAGVQDQPGTGPDGDRERVRDGVVDRDELELERAERAARPPPRHAWSGLDAVLTQLGLDQRQGQPRADQRDVRAARAAGTARRRCGPRVRG